MESEFFSGFIAQSYFVDSYENQYEASLYYLIVDVVQ